MRAKFKLEEVRFLILQKTGSERTSRARGRGNDGEMGLLRHHSFPNSDWHKKLESCAKYFCFVLAPDSPSFNRKEGTALQQLSRRHVCNQYNTKSHTSINQSIISTLTAHTTTYICIHNTYNT